jgi:hypothetical protein
LVLVPSLQFGITPLFIALASLLIFLLAALFPLALLFCALLILALTFRLALLFGLLPLLILRLAITVAPLLFGLAALRIVVPTAFVLGVLLVILFLFFAAHPAVPFAAILGVSDHRRSKR